ncbi:lactate utilization protein B [Desulfotomaculum defluvii]
MNTRTKAEKILSQIQVERQQLLSEYAGLAKQVTETKNSTAKNLKQKVDQAIKMLGVKGCHVLFAKDAQEAREQISKILCSSKKVLLSKDPIFTEIHLQEYLQSNNVEIVRSDLGDSIVGQSVDVHPRIATINTPVLDKDKVITIKNDIREQASQIEYGITGADAIVAETGTIALLESEGHVRLTSNLPYKHIVIAGLEKVLSTLEEALVVCRATSIYGLGKDLLSYISFISGPSRTADIEFKMVQGMHGPKEVFVILLDNGRLEDSNKGDLAALKCLHCGGCLVDCPAYIKEGLQQGYRYTGKRKKVLAKYLTQGSDTNEVEYPGCSSCNKCDRSCPVGISI